MSRPALSRGQHPTADDLTKMRLGYPGYASRLESMRALKPARYAAVMAGVRTFLDPGWRCADCHGNERYTRNLACRGCAMQRPEKVFRPVPGVGVVYTPTDEQASMNWQERRQRLQRLQDHRLTLRRVGPVAAGPYILDGGRVLNAGAVALDTEPLMAAVDALLSGDTDEIRAVLTPVLAQSRELVHLVRLIATAVSKPQNPRK